MTGNIGYSLKYALIIAIAAAALVLGKAGHAGDDFALLVKAENVHAYATAKGQKSGAVFLQLQNHTEETLRLIHVSSGVSDTVEMHSMVMDADIMQMRKVEGFDIQSHGELILQPSGDHIMLMDLKAPLVPGQEFQLRLDFENGKSLDLAVQVVPPGSQPATEGGAHDAHSHH